MKMMDSIDMKEAVTPEVTVDEVTMDEVDEAEPIVVEADTAAESTETEVDTAAESTEAEAVTAAEPIEIEADTVRVCLVFVFFKNLFISILSNLIFL